MEKKAMRDLSETLRDEIYIRDRISNLLRQGPKTIPELAVELGSPSREVFRWVMSLRRYGIIGEIPKERADDYYRYIIRGEEGA